MIQFAQQITQGINISLANRSGPPHPRESSHERGEGVDGWSLAYCAGKYIRELTIRSPQEAQWAPSRSPGETRSM